MDILSINPILQYVTLLLPVILVDAYGLKV